MTVQPDTTSPICSVAITACCNRDGSDAVIDLTGYTAYAQAWNKERTKKYADFGSITDEWSNHNQFDRYAKCIVPRFVGYDVLLENPSSSREYYLQGTITVSEGYTQP